MLTLNEERLLAPCLASLAAAQRIVVLDCGSTDRTPEIARDTPGVELLMRPFRDFADQRNHGLSHFEPGGWVLHIDADERLTPGLAEELRHLEPRPEQLAYNVASRTFIDGRPVLRASGYPVYQTRLTRAGAFRFEQVGHGQKAPLDLGPLPRLVEPYDHHPFERGFEHWLASHEKYADDEAAAISRASESPRLDRALTDPVARRQWLRILTARMPFRPTLVWIFLMFLRGGALDGPPGWEFCRRRRLYERMVTRKLRAARRS